MMLNNLFICWMISLCTMVFFFSGASALYATQLGVYDWLRKGIGYVEESVISNSGALIVSTEDGVLASLNVRDGSLVWRNALPEGGDVEQFALSDQAEADIVYALISTPCKAGDVECRNLLVQAWTVHEGTLLFETYLGQSSDERDSGDRIFDIAYYSSSNGKSSLMALAKNNLYDIDIINGVIKSKWSPKEASVRLVALANRKSISRNIIAIGCVASGAMCSKISLVRTKGSVDEAFLVHSASISGLVKDLRPALGFSEGTDWAYIVKSNSLQLFSVASGRTTTVNLPSMIEGGEVSYSKGYALAPKGGDAASGEQSCGAILILRCSSKSCQSNKYYLPCPTLASATIVISPAVLMCKGTGARIGVGRALATSKEAASDVTLSCAGGQKNPDQEGREGSEFGVGISTLDGKDSLVSTGSAFMAVPSTRQYGFSSVVYTSCHLHPTSTKKGKLTTILCVYMTSAGTILGIGRKSNKWTHLWTREEALSRAVKAGLHEPPAALREALEKHRGEESAISLDSVTSFVDTTISSVKKVFTLVLEKIPALHLTMTDPFQAAAKAGNSLSAQESSRSLAAMQAKLYGFDKIGIFLTKESSGTPSSGVGTKAPSLLVALDMSTSDVLWINELTVDGLAGAGLSLAKAHMVRTDVDIISLVVSSKQAGSTSTTIADVDIKTGAWRGSAVSFPGYSLQGLYPLETSLTKSLENLGANPDKNVKKAHDSSSVRTYALLFETEKADTLRVAVYPARNSPHAAVGGFFVSRITTDSASSSNSMTNAQFQTLQVLDSITVFQAKCVDTPRAFGANNGECTTTSIAMHDVETVATSVFSSAGKEGVTMENVAAIAYQHPADVVNSRVTALGDDSLLMKYLNPTTALVITEHKVHISDNITGSQLEVHFLDTISAKLLYRSSIPNGANPVQAAVVENHLVVVYWNNILKRTEMSSVSLFEGMIDKKGLTPWASKASSAVASKHMDARTFNSFSSPLPMAIQKTYILPKTVTAIGTTITKQGVAKKALIVGTAGGQLFSVDRQIINPRRPLENPTNAEKADGLFRYEPYLQLDNMGSPTHNYSMAFAPFLIVSAPSKLESSSMVLSLSHLDVHFNRVIPSMAFDLLSPDFNYPLLCLIVAALVVMVVWMQRSVAARKKAKAWE